MLTKGYNKSNKVHLHGLLRKLFALTIMCWKSSIIKFAVLCYLLLKIILWINGHQLKIFNIF